MKKTKNCWYSLPRKKVRISIGNIDFFAYSIFKNIEILLGQGVVQIRPNLAWSIISAVRAQNEKDFWYSLPRKKLDFHTEISEFLE